MEALGFGEIGRVALVKPSPSDNILDGSIWKYTGPRFFPELLNNGDPRVRMIRCYLECLATKQVDGT